MKNRIFWFIIKLGVFICNLGERLDKIGNSLYKYGAQAKYNTWVKTLAPTGDTSSGAGFPPAVVKGGCEVQTGCFKRVDC
jgi:hypothetical protein